MANNLLSLSHLQIKRGSFCLEIPKWEVEAGEVIGLVGPNGAGKTTLLESLAGLRSYDKGEVSIFGYSPWSHPVEVRSHLGFMADNTPLFDLRLGPLLKMVSGYYPTWDSELVEELLERFQLDSTQKVRELSKGQGTRVRLVLAMAFRPKLLLLDEPASGLDLAGRRSLLKSVLDVVRDPERSVVISSHLLQDVERIADKLLVLSKGKVVKEGPTDVLIGETQTLEEAMEAWGAA